MHCCQLHAHVYGCLLPLACLPSLHPALCLQENDPAGPAGSPTCIKSVSSCSLGGRAVITPGADSGKDVIRYISKKPATAGADTFNYTTELGTASVRVVLTPGVCSESNCGVQQRKAATAGSTANKVVATQPGTCQAGRCVCVPGRVQGSSKPAIGPSSGFCRGCRCRGVAFNSSKLYRPLSSLAAQALLYSCDYCQ
jgi:hypothetical protein